MARDQWAERTTLLVQIGVTTVVLVAALWVILVGDYPDDFQNWAFGMEGLVVGYWLR